MASLIKKSFQLGKAVYATANEMISEQTNKPQHPQGGYYPQQSGAHVPYSTQQPGGGHQQGGSYGQVNIPGQHTPNGQAQSLAHKPPALPPRPQEHASNPNPQSYSQHHSGYAQAQAHAPQQQSHGPTQGYVASNLQAVHSPTYSQAAYGASAAPLYSYNAQSQQYGPHAGTGPPSTHGPGQPASQVTGTTPSHQSSQSSWSHGASLPTPPIYQTQPLSAWERAGSTPSPSSSSYPQTMNWTAMSPPPQTVSPLNSQGPYTPPAPMNAPLQPSPQQYNSSAPSPIFQPQQLSAQNTSQHIPTPPVSPPLFHPSVSQPYVQGPQYVPVSPPAHSERPYDTQPCLPPRNGSLPSPISQHPSYSTSPVHQHQPQPRVQSPVSPIGGHASQLPHPPAFVSELPAFSEPKADQAPLPHLKPKSSFIAAPIPDGYAELPADLYVESAAKPSTEKTSPHLFPSSTPPMTAANQNPSTSSNQPNSLQSPPKSKVAASPPVGYAPQQYIPAQSAHTPPAQPSYQPYHPTEPPAAPRQSSPQEQHAQPLSNASPGGYKPYHAPLAQSTQQYQALSVQSPPAQHAGTPQRMGALASKFSSVNLNGSQPQPTPLKGPPQYLPYPT